MENQQVNKILVPIDYSETSLNALNYAIGIGLKHSAVIHLLYVVDPNTYLSISSNGLELDLTQESIINIEKEKLTLLADSINQNNKLSFVIHCCVNQVVDGIIHKALTDDVDIIIMGTDGKTSIKSFFMGTNAYEVCKNANCPVLTVPLNSKWKKLEKILFPIRTIPNAIDKYDFTRKLLDPEHSQIIILALLDDENSFKMDKLDREIKKLNEKITADHLNSYFISTYTDSIAYTALRKSESLEVDLIVITADFEASLEAFFKGPYTQQILNYAKIPVLSIRPQISKEVTDMPNHISNTLW